MTLTEGNEVTLKLRHLGTTRERFTYSKWEIDRWGDPEAIFTPEPGAWRVVTNQANDVVFALWAAGARVALRALHRSTPATK